MIRNLSLSLLVALASFAARPQDATEPFIEQSLAGLQTLQAANDATWKMQEASRWDVDQASGRIAFTFADGRVASAPFQIVGSYNPRDGSFLWAWANPSVDERFTRASLLVRRWAEANGLARWTERKVLSSEAEAWRFAGVAARLDGASGAYRAPTGGPVVFLVFGDVRLSKREP